MADRQSAMRKAAHIPSEIVVLGTATIYAI